jgi:uncharacterized membrane protein
MRKLGKGLVRWLTTAVLLAAVAVNLERFAQAIVIRNKMKKAFNALITALSLALGLNVAVSNYTPVWVGDKHAESVV